MTGRLFSLYFKRHIDDISSILSVKTARLLLKLLEIKRDIFLLCYAWCLESENLDKILKRGKMVWMKAWFDLIFSFFLFTIIKRLFFSFSKILGLSKSFLAEWVRRKSSLVLLMEDTMHVKNNWSRSYSASKAQSVYDDAWVNGTHTKEKKRKTVLFLIKFIFKIIRTFWKSEEFHFMWVYSRRKTHIYGSLQNHRKILSPRALHGISSAHDIFYEDSR